MQDRAIKTRIAASKQHTLLLGPRQVGKSTLVRSLNPGRYINFAEEDLFLSYARDPGLLKREVLALKKAELIVIDEVQRLPALLNSVQALIDDNPLQHRFILTGSSARKLKRGGANLLPGRVIVEHMHPLLVSELNASFDLNRALQFGLLPGVYLNVDSGMPLLESYASTYLKEEIQTEGLAQNIGAFARLLDIVALSSGQWLNYSKLSSDTEIPKETIRRYVSLLQDTLVLHVLESFRPTTAPSRRISQKSKIILFDLGVRNALLRTHAYPPSLEQYGALFEQWFILQVLGLVDSYRKPWKVSSFLTGNLVEVDLVIETPSGILGIEIKSGKTLHQRSHPGLAALQQVVGNSKPLTKWIVYSGDHRQELADGVQAIPFIDALQILLEMH